MRILLIEDNPVYAKLVTGLLMHGDMPFKVDHALSLSDAETCLKKRAYDVILADLTLPEVEGLETLKWVMARASNAPVVVMTAVSDESLALDAVHLGAQDYLIKGQFTAQHLRRSLRYAAERHSLINGRGGLGTMVDGLLNSMTAAVAVLECQRDRAGLISDFTWRLGNGACADILGVPFRDLAGTALSSIAPEIVSGGLIRALSDVVDLYTPLKTDAYLTLSQGPRWISLSAGRMDDGVVLVMDDVTERRSQKGELVSARRDAEAANRAKTLILESVREDLRQPMNTILGFAEAMRSEVSGPLHNDQYRAYVGDIHHAAQEMSSIIEGIMDRARPLSEANREIGYREMVDLAPDMVCICRAGVIETINAAGRSLLGIAPDASCIGCRFADFVHGDFQHLITHGFEILMSDHGRLPMKLVSATGRFIDVEMAATLIDATPQEGGGPVVMVVVRDVTRRQLATRAIMQREERLRKIVETMVDGLIIIDQKGIIETFNSAAERIFGYSANEIVGRSVNVLMPRIISESHDQFLSSYMRTRKSSVIGIGREVEGLHADGRTIPLDLALSELCLDDKHYFIGVLRDITDRKQNEERLRLLATRDPLTQLPNRAMYRERLEAAIQQADTQGGRFGVLFVDLDHFKNINDTLGHQVGDCLLQRVARCIEQVIQRKDAVFHLSGDEFTVVLDPLENSAEAAALASRLLAVLAQPFEVDGREIYTSGSIGIVLYPENADSIEGLLKNVDTAVHHAKRQGRNTFTFYSEQISETMIRRLQIENGLRRAGERNELAVVYQPKVDLHTGACVGAEALLRWNSQELGFISPAEFIPIAEETGQIVEIGEWVLLQVCRQIALWIQQGRPALRIAVNLSARQFRESGLITRIMAILKETAIPAEYLELELTESMLIENANEAVKALRALKGLGITLSIDDFGTGYSSLSYLKRFPIDSLKIDQSFVRDIPDSHDDMSITKAIISMGQSLDLKLVAEGTETFEQVEFLRRNGCDIAQGYYFSKPVAPDVFERFLDERIAMDAGL